MINKAAYALFNSIIVFLIKDCIKHIEKIFSFFQEIVMLGESKEGEIN